MPPGLSVQVLTAALFGAGLMVAGGALLAGQDSRAASSEAGTAEVVQRPAGGAALGQSSAGGAGGGSQPAPTPTVTDEGAVVEPEAASLPEKSRETNGRFTMPLRAWSEVTDRYGARNRGPGRIHGGIDLALDGYYHTEVFAACTGTVTSAEYSSSYGNHVFVDCGDGWSTLYGHFSSTLVVPGQAVTPADVLGRSGTSGFSTGEHLHFEIRWLGTPANPEDYLDFHIAPGTPLSNGPLYFPGGGRTSGHRISA